MVTREGVVRRAQPVQREGLLTRDHLGKLIIGLILVGAGAGINEHFSDTPASKGATRNTATSEDQHRRTKLHQSNVINRLLKEEGASIESALKACENLNAHRDSLPGWLVAVLPRIRMDLNNLSSENDRNSERLAKGASDALTITRYFQEGSLGFGLGKGEDQEVSSDHGLRGAYRDLLLHWDKAIEFRDRMEAFGVGVANAR